MKIKKSLFGLALIVVSMTPAHARVTATGVDGTTGPNWRTNATLETDKQYGTLGYVVFGLNDIDSQYRSPFDATSANPQNAYSLPPGISLAVAGVPNLWSGDGNFGQIEDPGAGNTLTSAPLLANYSPRQFTIARSASAAFRVTLMTSSGDGANATYTPSVNDGAGAASTTYKHTGNGVAYHVFDVPAGTSNIVIDVNGSTQWALTGIAFDAYVTPPAGPALRWVGATGAWDTSTAGNWKKVSDNSATLFSNSPPSPVTFDDSATTTTVNISPGDVTPMSVDFENSAKNYTLEGSGIAGTGYLTKFGGGTVTLRNVNTYGGGTTIGAGVLALGGAGQLGGGNYAAPITNNGSLVYDSSAAQTLAGAMEGSGGVTQTGAGTLTLAGVNTYAGNVLVSAGTLVATRGTGVSSSGSFGNLQLAGKTITINSGGTLRHGQNDLYFNSLPGFTDNLTKIVLDGGTLDTGAFFSNIRDLDLHSGAAITGTNGVVAQFRSLGLTGTITCKGGTGVASTIDSSGATGGLHLGNSGFGVSSVTFDVDAASGGLNISAPLYNEATSLATGALVKTGDGTLTLSGDSKYTGATSINAGTLAITGTLGTGSGPVTVNSTATLTGNGTISRPVTIAAGGTLTPAGATVGTLNIFDDLTFKSGAKVISQINKTGGTRTQDLLETNAVHYGGTLEIIATGETLALGDSFQLFTALADGYSGSFANVIKPSLPAGLSWEIARLNIDGTIEVVNHAPTPVFSQTAGGYVGAQSLTLSSDPGTTIHYTLDGTDPHTSGTAVSAASPASGIVIPTDMASFTLTAYASQTGRPDSPLTSAIYSTITTPAWAVDNDGNWSDSANWKNQVIADGIGVTGDFNSFPQTFFTSVTLDSDRTLGRLVFGNPDPNDWTVASYNNSILTLATSSGAPVIEVASQTAIISAALAGNQGLTKSGPGTLQLTNGSSKFTGNITIDDGLLLATGAPGGPSPTSSALGNPGVARTFTVNSGGTLSFGSNDFFGQHIAVMNVSLVINAGASVVNDGNFFSTLGPVTLNGGTINAVGGAVALYPSFSFKGEVTALTGVTSTISGTGINAAYHLGDAEITGTTFDVKGSGILNVPGILQNGQLALGGTQPSTLTKTGTGTMTLGGINTYTGNTTVDAGTLHLLDDAQLRFAIGNTSGASNQLSGAGTVILDGDFAINTTAAAALTSGSWKLENVASLTGAYGTTFTVVDPDGTPWTDAGANKWTKTVGDQEWTFDETTGTLNLGNGGGNFASWAGTNGVTGGPNGDSDHDGIPNLVEYALNLNFAGSDGSAGVFNENIVTFIKRAEAISNGDVAYAIETSATLAAGSWTTVVNQSAGNTDAAISYTLPAGQGKAFARLVVTQAP